MIDQELKQRLNDKIQAGKFTAADIPPFLTLFCQLGNTIQELQDEVAGWDRRIALELAGLGSYWLVVSGGRFSRDQGRPEHPDLLLAMTADQAARIFAGRDDAQAAYMSGALKVTGELPDAIKLRDLIEMVIDEIEN
jgi:putative sterol carrier protein